MRIATFIVLFMTGTLACHAEQPAKPKFAAYLGTAGETQIYRFVDGERTCYVAQQHSETYNASLGAAGIWCTQ